MGLKFSFPINNTESPESKSSQKSIIENKIRALVRKDTGIDIIKA
jgi:hypothetical protein